MGRITEGSILKKVLERAITHNLRGMRLSSDDITRIADALLPHIQADNMEERIIVMDHCLNAFRQPAASARTPESAMIKEAAKAIRSEREQAMQVLTQLREKHRL